MAEQLASWQFVWRNGFSKVLPLKGLENLARSLLRDDPALVQGSTTTPPPLLCVQDWACEAADAIGYAGWKNDPPLATVGEVEEAFAKACFEADQLLGEPAACRYFLNFWDDTPRNDVRLQFYPEVLSAIRERGGDAASLPEQLAIVKPEPIKAPF
jgi:hypothetical protein